MIVKTPFIEICMTWQLLNAERNKMGFSCSAPEVTGGCDSIIMTLQMSHLHLNYLRPQLLLE